MTEAESGDDWLALDLRIRLLECVVAGALSSSQAFAQRTSKLDSTSSIGRRAQKVLSQLQTTLDHRSNDVVRRFIQGYDVNEPLLHLPAPNLSQPELGSLSPLGPQEKLTFVFEAEAEVVQLEKELREIELLDSRGFTGAGKLADGDWSIEELVKTVEQPLSEIALTISNLEQRATSFMAKYEAYVNGLSELFISWDSILTALEDEVIRRQRQAASE